MARDFERRLARAEIAAQALGGVDAQAERRRCSLRTVVAVCDIVRQRLVAMRIDGNSVRASAPCRTADLQLQRCAVKTAALSAKLGPLPARPRHGPVELSPETVKDAHGAPAQPYRAVDTIELLLQRGIITKEAAMAADQFRRAFRVATLDPLRAADLSRVPGARGRGGDPPTWASERVSDAVDALGGQGSLVASCLWHIVGLEWSIRRWGREQAGIAQTNGTGVLIAALAILAAKGWPATRGLLKRKGSSTACELV
jgi:hypothetical protein